MILPAVTEDVTVTLNEAKALPVTIQLAEGAVPPPLPFGLEAELRILASPDQSRSKSSNVRDPRNDWIVNETADLAKSTMLTVDDPGLYEVRLWLRHRRPSFGSCEPLAQLGGNATVTVGEDGNASVTVTPDPADLKRLIERGKN